VACFDAEGSGVGSRLARVVWDFPSEVVVPLVSTLCGRRNAERVGRMSTYVCEERNPLVQLFYFFLMAGGYGLVLVYAYPRVPCSTLTSEGHKDAGLALFGSCLLSWVLACVVKPGRVDLAHDSYPYDGILFEEGRVCPTEKIVKIARSKFCRVARTNVPRFDHFCPWINAPVGEENYRWFLLFLAVHFATLSYGTFATAALLRDRSLADGLANAVFVEGGKMKPATTWLVLRYLSGAERVITGLFLLCVVMALLVFAFLAFHLFLVARGMTTNEFYKRRNLQGRRRRRLRIPNLYDRGFLLNLGEVLYPLCRRPPHLRPTVWPNADRANAFRRTTNLTPTTCSSSNNQTKKSD